MPLHEPLDLLGGNGTMDLALSTGDGRQSIAMLCEMALRSISKKRPQDIDAPKGIARTPWRRRRGGRSSLKFGSDGT
jgi:hypothetical protein